MATTATAARGERRVEATADFLRRLSIADAKVLLERTRKEKDNKTKEMQKMIGVRYRDLIESADKIVNMHSAALRLEVSLKEMPEMWKQMEGSLSSALAVDAVAGVVPIGVSSAARLRDSSCQGLETVTNKVAFLVAAPEKMWQLLDEGETLQALQVHMLAGTIYEECSRQSEEIEAPFLAAQWTCIQSFRPRILVWAKKYLMCRGKKSRFYADNLCTLAVLSNPRMKPDTLFETFLNARSNWMATAGKENEDKLCEKTSSQKKRVLMTMLRTVSMTIMQTEEIFGGGGGADGNSLLDITSRFSPAFKDELGAFITSGELLKMLCTWFQREQQKIAEIALPIVSGIDTILLLSQVQAQLNAASKATGGCLHAKLWSRVLHATRASVATENELKVHGSANSVFSVLYAEIFRKRTRDLVQNSFVEALNAIAAQFRGAVEDITVGNSRVDHRLKNIKFFEYFETIQKRAADLDASDLQIVLTEEFLRTLFKLVIFIEQEYFLPGERKDGDENVGNVQLPSVYLGISNIFAGIVAEFPRQRGELFPGNTSTVSISDKDPSLLLVGAAIAEHGCKGFVRKSQLRAALQDICGGQEGPEASFIAEELRLVEGLGYHSLYFVSEIVKKTSYPQLFVNVFHGLSKRYCEAWAIMILNQKIEPLRQLMQMEQYDLTNEEWIATHEGWLEQTISDEGLAGDTDDSSSESDLAPSDEKVWLPWCETPTVSSFLFSCCYILDDANSMIQSSIGAKEEQLKLMQQTIREVLVEQLTLVSVAVYDSAVSLLLEAKATEKESVLNFGECCIQQFLFDMYFVRATLGFSDFIRFGWGDELNPNESSPGLLKLKALFEHMHEFIDPVDWEIYGPQLIENVVLQFRKSRLLFSSLSESNDINKINGKEIVIGAQDTRPLARLAEPVARFSLLPVPSSRRRFQRTLSSMSHSSDGDTMEGRSRTNSSTLFHELTSEDTSGSQSSTLKLQNLLSTTASSNILSAAASGTNLLSSAAKGIGFFSSATSSYLREGETKSGDKFLK